jgi:hypothetical protein
MALRQTSSTLRLGVEWRGHFVLVTWRPPSLGEEAPSGAGIKVTKEACRMSSAFVASLCGKFSGALGRDLVTGKQYSCVECFNNVD